MSKLVTNDLELLDVVLQHWYANTQSQKEVADYANGFRPQEKQKSESSIIFEYNFNNWISAIEGSNLTRSNGTTCFWITIKFACNNHRYLSDLYPQNGVMLVDLSPHYDNELIFVEKLARLMLPNLVLFNPKILYYSRNQILDIRVLDSNGTTGVRICFEYGNPYGNADEW